MKNTLIVAAMAALLGTAAFAGGLEGTAVSPLVTAPTTAQALDRLDFVGNIEYAVEADQFETNLGIQYTVNDWVFVPVLTSTYDQVDDLQFEGASVTVVYKATANLDLYGKVSTDNSFDYEEANIGVAFRF